jgi:NADH:ubiquinone oxidoreductase subunit 4 (subunit M)
LFFGTPREAGKTLFPDMNFREFLALLPLAVLALWLGLSPNIILRPTEKSLQMNVVERLKPPPAMTDFAAQQRFKQEVQRDRQGKGQ